MAKAGLFSPAQKRKKSKTTGISKAWDCVNLAKALARWQGCRLSVYVRRWVGLLGDINRTLVLEQMSAGVGLLGDINRTLVLEQMSAATRQPAQNV